MLLLHFFTGCSDNSGEGMEDLTPATGNMGNKVVLYEANPKIFARTNALAAITTRLDEIKSLGTTVLWLMPIYEQGVENAVGSPYCVKDYKKLNAGYGTLDDVKTLVARAHEKGMRVIFDWVANHTSWDNAWMQNKIWYTQDANGNIISPEGMGWADVADLNYDNVDMRAAMLEAMKYWIEVVDIDGYRCDYAEGVPHDFWQQAINELKTIKGDDLLMLAEGSETTLFADGFDLVYGWDFAQELQAVFAGKSKLSALYKIHNQEYKGVPIGKQRLRYSTNHDLAAEKSPLEVYKNERGAMAAFVLSSYLQGGALIYSSQEVAFPGRVDFFHYCHIDWNANNAIRTEYEILMKLYNDYPAIRKGELKIYPDCDVAVFQKGTDRNRFLVLVNVRNAVRNFFLPEEWKGHECMDVYKDTLVALEDTLRLAPYEYRILKY